MNKRIVFIKVHLEGKFIVDMDKNINITDVTAQLPSCSKE